jgi:hypothetical protein
MGKKVGRWRKTQTTTQLKLLQKLKRGLNDTKLWLGSKMAKLLVWIRCRVLKANDKAIEWLHKNRLSPATNAMPQSRGIDQKKYGEHLEQIAQKCGF